MPAGRVSTRAAVLASVALAVAALAVAYTWSGLGLDPVPPAVAGILALFALGIGTGRWLAVAAPPAFFLALYLIETLLLAISGGELHGSAMFAGLVISSALSAVVALGVLANRATRPASRGSGG